MVKILSWNVNGLRSVASKGVLAALIEEQCPDVVCLQEIKCSSDVAEAVLKDLGFAHVVVAESKKAGYAGVAMACRTGFDTARVGLVHAPGFADEGRVVTVTLADLCIVGCYTPNSKPKLERLGERVGVWEPAFRKHLGALRASRLVVVGDLNVAPADIDVHDPSRLVTSPGFTPQEREAFRELLDALGLVDCFRTAHPQETAYTYWSYLGKARERNKGWRIDHALVGKKVKVNAVTILSSVRGSDHCPIVVAV